MKAATRKHGGYRKGSRSKTHKGRKDFTTKRGDKVFHRRGKYVRKSRKPYHKKRGGSTSPSPYVDMSTDNLTAIGGYRKGSRSKTHKGRKDFTTKRGDKVFHRRGKYVRKSRKPYHKKGGCSPWPSCMQGPYNR